MGGLKPKQKKQQQPKMTSQQEQDLAASNQKKPTEEATSQPSPQRVEYITPETPALSNSKGRRFQGYTSNPDVIAGRLRARHRRGGGLSTILTDSNIVRSSGQKLGS